VTGTGWLIAVAGVSLVLIGAPLFTAIGIAAGGCVMLISDLSGVAVATDMFEATKKQELLAIPFFVLAGAIMTQGSIAERLIGVARAILGPVPGGLGLATIFACCIFAAISGSSPVTVIAIGSILFPMLTRERYPEDYSLGVLTSAGSLGIIIPPSVPMIVYAIMVSTPQNILSPADLFKAGILPGLFIAGVLALYTVYRTRPGATDVPLAPWAPAGGYWRNLARETRRGILSLLLPVLILGGIYGWLGPLRFTVTEAAAVAVVYALFVELVLHRELKLHQLPKVLSDSGVMMGSLFLIIVLAIAFNKFLTFQEIPQDAAVWLAGQIDSQWKFLILVNLFLLVLGCIMEILSAILIVAPLLAPIAVHYGMDPVHFGIMFIVNLELGYLTPPMGINLFVASTVFDRPIVKVIRATLPFLLLMLFCLAVIAWFPSLSLALLDR
jgi:C4-dicarboxylate transporter, DctM subunit